MCLLHHRIIVIKVKGVEVGVMVYHIHRTDQIISDLVKMEGGMVLPDINLNSKEVQTSHLGVINITSHKGRDQLCDLEIGTGFAFGADQANHLIKNCPYYNQGRKDWWTQQGVTSDNPDPAAAGHTPRQGPN